MRKIVSCEAGGQELEAQIAIANVILNRLKSEKFPNTIKEVVYQSNQFPPVYNGIFDRASPNDVTIKAVQMALEGVDNSQGALYFCAGSEASGGWHDRNLTYLFALGGNVFYK